jgi:hypothetical protein
MEPKGWNLFQKGHLGRFGSFKPQILVGSAHPTFSSLFVILSAAKHLVFEVSAKIM